MRAAATVTLGLAALCGAAAQDPFAGLQQAVNDMFGGSSSDSAAPMDNSNNPTIPTFDLGTLFSQLNSFMSGLGTNVNTWASDAMQSDPARAQDYQGATQSVNDAAAKLNQLMSANTPPSFDDFTRGVLCDMQNSLNAVVDSGLADLGFDLLPYNTVDGFDLTQFMGKWYQVYAGQVLVASADYDLSCIRSDYKQTGDTTFDLTDTWTAASQQRRAVSTSSSSRTGSAEERSTGKFRVQYDNNDSCLSHGLWVLRTGPVTNGKYDWAIVGDPFALSVRVLARDPKEFKDKYESSVIPDFESSFEGFMQVLVPIDQSNCPEDAPATTTTTAVAPSPKPTAAPKPKPKPQPAAQQTKANAQQLQETQANTVCACPAQDDDNDTGLWVAIGILAALLALTWLGMLTYCCVRRRRNQARMAAAVVPATKSVPPRSNDKLVSTGSKTCMWCQGPQCIYGGQKEHDLARKLEDVDYSAAPTGTTAATA